MAKLKLKLLYIIISFLIFKPVLAEESWYQTAANLHKEWAKTYHTVSDLKRYTNIHKLVIGKDVELKPGKVSFPGWQTSLSMNVKVKDGAMAKVIGAEDFAYNGKTFNSFTADYSKCKKKEKQNDCTHHFGSVRTELTSKNDWTFTEGTEKWINYAMMPANNMLFPKNHERKVTVGQCHPDGHKIMWMMTIQSANLVLNHEFSSFKNNGEWKPTSMEKRRVLKKFKVNENYGTDSWTNIRINFKNTKKPDGKLKVWVDEKLAYDYEGPTNWGKKKHKGKHRNKCYFKFGIYTNANQKAEHKHLAEGMTVFTDYMAMAKTEEKLEALLLKDK
ncbi:polysaccharide lyase [Candidatus Pelagibacter sp.]|nr:polysaccharide lyase [Candidatus Pelagibacter sp.]